MMNRYLLGIFAGLLVTLLGCHRDEITVSLVSKVPQMESVAAPAAADSNLKWRSLSSWKTMPASPPRLASFEIPVSGRICELSITSFPGDTGGLLANVNRWRSQLGLAPIESDQLPALLKTVPGSSFQFQWIELVAQDRAMTVAILTDESQSWFFKVTGKRQDVRAVHPEFRQFLKTVSR
jgi:hypothetical protein